MESSDQEFSFRQIVDSVKGYVRLGRALYNDHRVPLLARILFWLAVGYVLLPFDLIPDFLPVIGYLDDMILIPALLYWAFRMVPSSVYREHYNRIFQKEE